MQVQKNLYKVVITEKTKGVKDSVEQLFDSIFKSERNSYQTKYRVIDGAFYKADDIKISLSRVENAEHRITAQNALFSLYSSIYEICTIIEENKVETMVSHKLPKRATTNSTFSMLDMFVTDNIIPLLDYVKQIAKDNQTKLSFDDCVNIVVILSVALESIDHIGSKKPNNYKMLGTDFEIEITDKVEEQEDEKVEEQTEKVEEKQDKKETINQLTTTPKSDIIIEYANNIIKELADFNSHKEAVKQITEGIEIKLPKSSENSDIFKAMKEDIDKIINDRMKPLQFKVAESSNNVKQLVNKMKQELDSILQIVE